MPVNDPFKSRERFESMNQIAEDIIGSWFENSMERADEAGVPAVSLLAPVMYHATALLKYIILEESNLKPEAKIEILKTLADEIKFLRESVEDKMAKDKRLKQRRKK